MGGPNNMKGRKKKKKRSPQRAIDVQNETSNNVCAFCYQPKLEGNEVERAGNLFKLGNKHFHYFCVLFCQKMDQSGEDHEGLKGFLIEDVEAGLRYGKTRICDFCKRHGAGLHCNYLPSNNCDTKYHYTCAVQQGKHTFMFSGMMDSFCPKHGPKQSFKLKVKDNTCLAGCQEKIDDTEDRVMISPCCGRKYHLDCIQGMASASGIHHFKCPACSVKEQFLEAAIAIGIYIPFQDAAWEKDSFYDFESQGRLYQRCDAKVCKCPKGREHHLNGTKFEVVRCESCGCGGMHIYCGNLLKQSPLYICDKHSNSERQMLDHIESIKRSSTWTGSGDEFSDEDESTSNNELCKTTSCVSVLRKTPASSLPTSSIASDEDSDYVPENDSNETSELDKSKELLPKVCSEINDENIISINDDDLAEVEVHEPEDPYQVQQELTQLFEQSKTSPIKTYTVPTTSSLPFALKHPVTNKRIKLQSDSSLTSSVIEKLPNTVSSSANIEIIPQSIINSSVKEQTASNSGDNANISITSSNPSAQNDFKETKAIIHYDSLDDGPSLPTIEMIFSMANVPRDFPPLNPEEPEILTTKIIKPNDSNDVIQLIDSDDDDIVCMDNSPASPTNYSPREDPYPGGIVAEAALTLNNHQNQDNVILLD